MFGNHLPKRPGYCKSKCTLKEIFSYVRWAYSCNTTKTFILVWINKHHPQSATALLKMFVQNNWRWGDIDFTFQDLKIH